MADPVRVQVVYADRQRQIVRAVEVASGASVNEAIRASAILAELPQGFEPAAIGVWGRIVGGDETVRQGDRIELYRPLRMDPKEARRRRAARR